MKVTPEQLLTAVSDAKAKVQTERCEPPRFLYLGEWQQQAFKDLADGRTKYGRVIQDPNYQGKPSTLMGLEIVPVNKPDHLAVS